MQEAPETPKEAIRPSGRELRRIRDEKKYTMEDGTEKTFNQATTVEDIRYILKKMAEESPSIKKEPNEKDKLATSPRIPENDSLSQTETNITDLEGETPLFTVQDYQEAQQNLDEEVATADTDLQDEDLKNGHSETEDEIQKRNQQLIELIKEQVATFTSLPPAERQSAQKNLLIEAGIRLAGIPANKQIDADDVKRIDRMVKQIEMGGPTEVLQRSLTIKNLIKGMKRL